MADELQDVMHAPKKPVLIAAGVAAVFVGWRWYKARKSSAQAAADAPTALPVDTSNLASSQGDVGYSNPNPMGGGTSTGGAAAGATTDQEWTQKVLADLTALSYDSQAVSTAIGLYLSGQPLTLDQQNIIRMGWAFEGKPPQHTSLPMIPATTTATTSQPPPTPTPEPTPNPEPAPAPVPGPPPVDIPRPTPVPTLPTPAPAPPVDPNLHYTSNGTISLNTLARWNNSTPARIIAATSPSEPADVAHYLSFGSYDHILPVNTRWNIPRN